MKKTAILVDGEWFRRSLEIALKGQLPHGVTADVMYKRAARARLRRGTLPPLLLRLPALHAGRDRRGRRYVTRISSQAFSLFAARFMRAMLGSRAGRETPCG